MVAGIAVVVLMPQATDAFCVCTKACGSILTATTLFEATVVAVDQPDGPGGAARVRLADVRAIRGDAPPDAVVSGGGECGYSFKVGTRYLVDAFEAQPGRYGASVCSDTRPLSLAAGLLSYSTAPPDLRPRVFGTLASRIADHYLRTGSATGPPVGGAVVSIAGPVKKTTTTNARGDFAFFDVPDGDYQLVVEVPRDRPDVAAPPMQSFKLGRDAACLHLTLIAPSTARVAGLVVDETGAPTAGVRVEIFPLPFDHWAGGIVTAATTNAAGRFAIERLAPGVYGGGVGVPYPGAATPYAPARAQTREGGFAIEVAPGASVELSRLTARRVQLTSVSGRVSGTTGATLGGLFVVLAAVDGFPSALTGGATTDADGRFTLDAYRGVRYEVQVEYYGRVIGAVEFVAGDGPIEVLLRPPPH
jgi:hypothetical protein